MRADEQAQRDSKQKDKTERHLREHEDRFLEALDQLDQDRRGVSVRAVRHSAGMSSDKASGAFYRLRLAGIVEELPDVAARWRYLCRIRAIPCSNFSPIGRRRGDLVAHPYDGGEVTVKDLPKRGLNQ